MRRLHIVQGGLDNGDKKWLERAARNHWNSRTWIAPSSYREIYGQQPASCPVPKDDAITKAAAAEQRLDKLARAHPRLAAIGYAAATAEVLKTKEGAALY